MNPETQSITLTHFTPVPIRWMLVIAGTGACFLALKELAPGLWPPSLLTLFFGFILLGGLSVGSAFVWAGVAAPDVVWTFSPGQLELDYSLRGQSWREVWLARDFASVGIEQADSDSGPTRWVLTCKLVEARFNGGPQVLQSPSFVRAEQAEAALALLGAAKPIP